MSGPYDPERVLAVLRGHRGLLDDIEPADESLPCGVVWATRADDDGMLVGVKWDNDPVQRVYRLTVTAAPEKEEGWW